MLSRLPSYGGLLLDNGDEPGGAVETGDLHRPVTGKRATWAGRQVCTSHSLDNTVEGKPGSEHCQCSIHTAGPRLNYTASWRTSKRRLLTRRPCPCCSICGFTAMHRNVACLTARSSRIQGMSRTTPPETVLRCHALHSRRMDIVTMRSRLSRPPRHLSSPAIPTRRRQRVSRDAKLRPRDMPPIY